MGKTPIYYRSPCGCKTLPIKHERRWPYLCECLECGATWWTIGWVFWLHEMLEAHRRKYGWVRPPKSEFPRRSRGAAKPVSE